MNDHLVRRLSNSYYEIECDTLTIAVEVSLAEHDGQSHPVLIPDIPGGLLNNEHPLLASFLADSSQLPSYSSGSERETETPGQIAHVEGGDDTTDLSRRVLTPTGAGSSGGTPITFAAFGRGSVESNLGTKRHIGVALCAFILRSSSSGVAVLRNSTCHLAVLQVASHTHQPEIMNTFS